MVSIVRGIDVFKEYFEGHDNYVIIGGLATAMVMHELGFVFRATKDIDLVVKAKEDEEFLKKLLQFVKDGGYETKERTNNPDKHNMFRFLNPTNDSYPEQIELFAVHAEDSVLVTDQHIIPIETPETYHYLSAILLNEDYFNLLMENTETHEGVNVANAAVLIPLKIHAHLSLKEVQHPDAKKHFNDIIRLASAIEEEKMDLKGLPKEEFEKFLPLFREVPKDTVRNVLKSMSITGVSKEDLIATLESIYS